MNGNSMAKDRPFDRLRANGVQSGLGTWGVPQYYLSGRAGGSPAAPIRLLDNEVSYC